MSQDWLVTTDLGLKTFSIIQRSTSWTIDFILFFRQLQNRILSLWTLVLYLLNTSYFINLRLRWFICNWYLLRVSGWMWRRGRLKIQVAAEAPTPSKRSLTLRSSGPRRSSLCSPIWSGAWPGSLPSSTTDKPAGFMLTLHCFMYVYIW